MTTIDRLPQGLTVRRRWRPPVPGVHRVRAGAGRGLLIGRAHASAPYWTGRNEVPVQEALKQRLRPGGTFLDVGANVGFFSLIAARLVGEAGTVVAFEPVPAVAAALRANVRRNGFRHVVVRTEAVGAATGTTTLRLTRHPGGATIAAEEPLRDAAGELRVPVVSLDQVVVGGGAPHPDVVKIDVEGAEAEVLDGMARLLAAGTTVLLEVDGPDPGRVAAKTGAIRRRLAAAGYRLEELEPSYPRGDWVVAHLLATPATAGPRG